MISDKQPYIYRYKEYTFYAFFEKWEFNEEGYKSFKGINFYIFDQHGYCWDSAINVTRKWIKDKADGFFLEKPAWEADGLPMREPLERYTGLAKGNPDLAYALETVKAATGLDLLLILGKESTCTD